MNTIYLSFTKDSYPIVLTDGKNIDLDFYNTIKNIEIKQVATQLETLYNSCFIEEGLSLKCIGISDLKLQEAIVLIDQLHNLVKQTYPDYVIKNELLADFKWLNEQL